MCVQEGGCVGGVCACVRARARVYFHACARKLNRSRDRFGMMGYVYVYARVFVNLSNPLDSERVGWNTAEVYSWWVGSPSRSRDDTPAPRVASQAKCGKWECGANGILVNSIGESNCPDSIRAFHRRRALFWAIWGLPGRRGHRGCAESSPSGNPGTTFKCFASFTFFT